MYFVHAIMNVRIRIFDKFFLFIWSSAEHIFKLIWFFYFYFMHIQKIDITKCKNLYRFLSAINWVCEHRCAPSKHVFMFVSLAKHWYSQSILYVERNQMECPLFISLLGCLVHCIFVSHRKFSVWMLGFQFMFMFFLSQAIATRVSMSLCLNASKGKTTWRKIMLVKWNFQNNNLPQNPFVLHSNITFEHPMEHHCSLQSVRRCWCGSSIAMNWMYGRKMVCPIIICLLPREYLHEYGLWSKYNSKILTESLFHLGSARYIQALDKLFFFISFRVRLTYLAQLTVNLLIFSLKYPMQNF